MPSTKAKKRIKKIQGNLVLGYSAVSLRYTRLNRKLLKTRHKRLNIDRLHVGCGDIFLRDWLNIFYEQRLEYGRTKRINGAWGLNYNLCKEWPFDDNSIQYIAGSHFIEHLDLNEAIVFAKEAFRVLKPKGVVRLSCPDLEIYARHYVARNKEFFENELIREWCCYPNAVTCSEVLAAKAYDSGGAHKWFFDFESLQHILKTAGFNEVNRLDRLEGKVPDLELLEPPKRELETVYVEAVKN